MTTPRQIGIRDESRPTVLRTVLDFPLVIWHCYLDVCLEIVVPSDTFFLTLQNGSFLPDKYQRIFGYARLLATKLYY